MILTRHKIKQKTTGIFFKFKVLWHASVPISVRRCGLCVMLCGVMCCDVWCGVMWRDDGCCVLCSDVM